MPPGPGYYPEPPAGHRSGYPPDWGRDRDYEYRREYDRRAPPPSSGNT